MRRIDADALKETIDREIFRHDTIDHVFQIIDDAPTIEPKRGEWIALGENDISGYWECSACGSHTEAFGAYAIYKYCPFCGADMRGENNE